jgi:hypothetical protein
MGRSQNDGVKMTNFEPREKMFHVHKSAIQENNFKEHVNFYTGPAPSEDFVTLYTAPPKREWVGLTEDEAIELLPVGDWEIQSTLDFARAIEAKLKEKNT